MMTSSNGNIFPRYWPFVRGIHRSPVKWVHLTFMEPKFGHGSVITTFASKCDATTHSFPSFNGGLPKPPLNSKHGWKITLPYMVVITNECSNPNADLVNICYSESGLMILFICDQTTVRPSVKHFHNATGIVSITVTSFWARWRLKTLALRFLP